jgi:hypothetical protein
MRREACKMIHLIAASALTVLTILLWKSGIDKRPHVDSVIDWWMLGMCILGMVTAMMWVAVLIRVVIL